ncbi:MAG: methionine synthase [Tidjanibacter sp.]|nr:methionine synthase [Tidjanibacter sp.]
MINDIRELLKERILLLDGGLGTMVQSFGLAEEDYRGERFAEWHTDLKGCNDLLVLTRPDVIREIHTQYLRAGADIITTDTFNANAVSMADYGLEEYVYEMAREAARLARGCADEFTLRNPSKPRFVAGSVGPTNKTAAMSADVDDPEARGVDFDGLVAAYTSEIEGLVDGGANLLILETFFDTLNCKAAIFAAEQVFEQKGVHLPVIVSGTLTNSGRMLAGQSVEAFYTSVEHAEPLAVSLNCSFGAKQLQPYLKRLAEVSRYPVAVYPNAGLPNLSGGYDETPAMMAADVEEYLKEGLVNIVGGCCGTTPLHIAEFAKVVKNYKPRRFEAVAERCTAFSGLDRLTVTAESNFINIGERTNVSGSAKFARLIREEKFDEALSIARNQVENGAQIVDVCFDDGMIDGKTAMRRFLNLAAAEPDIAKVPFMIDSSSWDVLETGLKCVQGKSIVNSISLKEGEEEFVRRARLIKRYGAAVVVMLFDERGQADTYERKIEVAERAYKILTGIGFDAYDIIFDPNVLAVATGIEAHNRYGIDFIKACGWIKQNLPGVNISGGVSNLSFAFRGINSVRQALHSVFLYHAIEQGMNMGIVNPAMVTMYDDIEPELLKLTSDVVLATDAEAGDRLAQYAQRLKESESGATVTIEKQTEQWREKSPAERISYAMLKGVTEHIEEDVLAAYGELGDPLAVIDKCFMPAMAQVGELFGSGKMFLPQVVKSARVMKSGVGVLTPMIESGREQGKSSGRVVMATVKGDVHDIGKNIVAVVMNCNGYEINDLGVMVDPEKIADVVQEWHADAVGLSGLITPSLDEMIKVVKEFEKRGLTVPVMIGGATTSALHTAVKIAPCYSGLVVHGRDASDGTAILNKLLGDEVATFAEEVRAKQAVLRSRYEQGQSAEIKSFVQATADREVKSATSVVAPKNVGTEVLADYTVGGLRPYIDWSFFFNAWGVKGRYPEIFDHAEKGEEARRLFADANAMLDKIEAENLLQLRGVVGIFKAEGRENDIWIEAEDGRKVRLAQLRNQTDERSRSLADYVAENDYVGLFAVSAGVGLAEHIEAYKAAGNDYDAIMIKLLADRLTEALGQVAHLKMRRQMWGYEQGEMPSVQDVVADRFSGARMAFGYPSCPDHSLKKEVFELLNVEERTPLRLTENYMISPGESICGIILADERAEYFDVGRIDEEQLADYAARRGMDKEEIKRLIPNNI